MPKQPVKKWKKKKHVSNFSTLSTDDWPKWNLHQQFSKKCTFSHI